MNRLSSLALISFLSACAAEAPQAPPVITTTIHDVKPVAPKPKPPVAAPVPAPAASVPPDARCVSLGKYAKAIANLKTIGVSLSDLGSFSNSPVALEIPMKALQINVYAAGTSADETATEIQEDCVKDGYNSYIVELTREQRARIKILQMDPEPGAPLILPSKK